MAKGARRDRRLEAEWRRIIRGYIRSALGVREFCAKSKLAESAFYYWRRELHRRQAEQEQHPRRGSASATAAPPSKPAFLPVCMAEEIAPSAVAGRIEIVLSNGRRVHVAAPVDRQALADVLAVAEA